MRKRLHHTGSTLRPRTVAEKAAIARGIEEKVWPLVAAGKIKPVIDFDLSAGQGRRRPCPHGDEPAHRQDRADGVSPVAAVRAATMVNRAMLQRGA